MKKMLLTALCVLSIGIGTSLTFVDALGELLPTQVQNVIPTAGNENVFLRWDEASDPDGTITSYNVYYGLSSGSGSYASSINTGNLAALVGGLNNNTEYLFGLKAVDNSGNESAEYSTQISVTPTEKLTVGSGPSIVNSTNILIAGTQDVEIFSLILSGGSQPIGLTDLYFTNEGDLSFSDRASFNLYNANGQLISTANLSGNLLHFQISSTNITENEELSIKASINSITQASQTGKQLRLKLSNAHGTNNTGIVATKNSSNFTNINIVGTPMSESFIAYRTMLTFANAPSQPTFTPAGNGSNQPIYRFTVTNDQSASAILNKVSIDVTGSTGTSLDVSPGKLRLVKYADSSYDGLSVTLGTNTEEEAIFSGLSEEVNGTNYYEVQAVDGYSDDLNSDSDYILSSFFNDTSFVSPENNPNIDTPNHTIWSDKSNGGNAGNYMNGFELIYPNTTTGVLEGTSSTSPTSGSITIAPLGRDSEIEVGDSSTEIVKFRIYNLLDNDKEITLNHISFTPEGQGLTGLENIELYNMAGDLLSAGTMNGDILNFDISNLSPHRSEIFIIRAYVLSSAHPKVKLLLNGIDFLDESGPSSIDHNLIRNRGGGIFVPSAVSFPEKTIINQAVHISNHLSGYTQAAPNTNNFIIKSFVIESPLTEKITKIEFDTKNYNVLSLLENLKLILDNVQIPGSFEIVQGKLVFTANSSFGFSGSQLMEIRANIKAEATIGSQFQIGFSKIITGVFSNSNNTSIYINDISTPSKIQIGETNNSLTIYSNPSQESIIHINSRDNPTISGLISNLTNEDIEIHNITIDINTIGSAKTHGLSATLFSDGVQQGSVIKNVKNGENNFSDLNIAIPAQGSKQIELLVDESTDTSGGAIAFSLGEIEAYGITTKNLLEDIATNINSKTFEIKKLETFRVGIQENGGTLTNIISNLEYGDQFTLKVTEYIFDPIPSPEMISRITIKSIPSGSINCENFSNTGNDTYSSTCTVHSKENFSIFVHDSIFPEVISEPFRIFINNTSQYKQKSVLDFLTESELNEDIILDIQDDEFTFIEKVTLKPLQSGSLLKVEIPAETDIQGTQNWFGDISAPKALALPSNNFFPEGFIPQKRIKVGSDNSRLTFNKPVKITIPITGSGSRRVFSSQNGSTWTFETTCTITNNLCEFFVNHFTEFTVGDDESASTSGETQAQSAGRSQGGGGQNDMRHNGYDPNNRAQSNSKSYIPKKETNVRGYRKSRKKLQKYIPCKIQNSEVWKKRLYLLKLSQGAPSTCREDIKMPLTQW